jgi:hypothetical protein
VFSFPIQRKKIMTVTHDLDTRAVPASATRSLEAEPVTWSMPETKFWVAERGGEFAGFVEFRDGHYEATDARGARLDSRGTLAQAKALIAEPTSRPAVSTTLVYLAVGAGATALSVLAVGLSFIPLG